MASPVERQRSPRAAPQVDITVTAGGSHQRDYVLLYRIVDVHLLDALLYLQEFACIHHLLCVFDGVYKNAKGGMFNSVAQMNRHIKEKELVRRGR